MTAANHEEKTFALPYRSKLREKIEPGQTLMIKGVPKMGAKRFSINLHRDSPDFSGNDVPLHIDVRFNEKKIVFNSFTKGAWGKEERCKNLIKKQGPFDIRIRAHDNKFVIFVDRKELKEYEHRVPLNSVSHLSIDGDAEINHVQWGGKYYPVPFESGIADDGLSRGKSLLIYGVPEKKAKTFKLNLLRKNGDIVLHLNPRFNERARTKQFICGCGRNGNVIRNAFLKDKWGEEEYEGFIPFRRGQVFDLEVRNESDFFQIFVNGSHFTSFAHRTDSKEIVGLQIQGDVEVTGIQIV